MLGQPAASRSSPYADLIVSAAAAPGPGSTTAPAREVPGVGDVGGAGAGQHGRRLHAGAGGDLLLDRGHDHGSAGQVGEHLAVRRRPGSAPDHHQLTAAGGERGQRLEAVEETAHDSFDGGPSELAALHVRAEAGQHPGRVGAVRGALAVEVRQQRQPSCTGGRGEGQLVELGVTDAQQAAHGVRHLGGVQRAHQRQEHPGGVGEPSDGARRGPRWRDRSRCRRSRTCRATRPRRRAGARSPALRPCCRRCRAQRRRHATRRRAHGDRARPARRRPSRGRRPPGRGGRTGRRRRRPTSSPCQRRHHGRWSAGRSAVPSASRAAGPRGPGDPTTRVRDGATRTAW